MILTFEDGQQIRGDLIITAQLRYDLAPIPVTLDASFRADDSMLKRLEEGKVVITGQGDRLQIVKCQPITGGLVRGDTLDKGVRIIAFLQDCTPASFVRERAVIKNDQTLLAIYRACGCKLKAVDSDFPVPKFVCMTGDTPTFHIARALQEAGGVVRWKNGRMQFYRVQDLFKQSPAIRLPNVATDEIESGFLERHQAPAFFSVAPDGSIVHGNRAKARAARFVPGKNAAQLHNMTRVLVRDKETKTDFAGHLHAGDIIDFVGGEPRAIITALHYFASGTDSAAPASQYTKLWSGRVMT